MISFMLCTSNKREEQILQTAFKQRGIDVHLFRPGYQHFVKMLQYLPDIIIMEFPRLCTEHMHFVKIIRKNKRLSKITIIGYGNAMDKSIVQGLIKTGIDTFILRPLNFSKLMEFIESALQKQQKSVAAPASENTKDEELKLLTDNTILPTKKIEIMVKHVAKLMAFPFTVAKVLKLAQDSKSGAADLAKVIQADLVISADLLKVSNTVFFASAGREIKTIKDAIVRIGFIETKRIVLSMSVMQLFEKDDKNAGFNRIDFWYHSLASAVFAEKLAKRMGSVSPEDAFLAGLLHDFGIVILDEFFPELFSTVLEHTANEGAHFIDMMYEYLKITQIDVVKELFGKWKIPVHITEAVATQYDFRQLQLKLDLIPNKLALCVGLANILAKSVFLGKECDQFIVPVENWIFKNIKMLTGVTAAFIDDVKRDVTLYRKYLKLEERNFAEPNGSITHAESESIGIINLAGDVCVPPLFYLENEGLSVELITPSEEIDTLQERFSILVIWEGNETTYEEISSYLTVRPNENSTNSKIQILICLRPESTLHTHAELRSISFMEQQCDLRTFNRNISDILLGNTVSFQRYVHDRHKASAVVIDQEERAPKEPAPPSPEETA